MKRGANPERGRQIGSKCPSQIGPSISYSFQSPGTPPATRTEERSHSCHIPRAALHPLAAVTPGAEAGFRSFDSAGPLRQLSIRLAGRSVGMDDLLLIRDLLCALDMAVQLALQGHHSQV
jgi:hypothetical protein